MKEIPFHEKGSRKERSLQNDGCSYQPTDMTAAQRSSVKNIGVCGFVVDLYKAHTDTQTSRQTDRQAGRQADRQADRQTDMVNLIHTPSKRVCKTKGGSNACGMFAFAFLAGTADVSLINDKNCASALLSQHTQRPLLLERFHFLQHRYQGKNRQKAISCKRAVSWAQVLQWLARVAIN
jgi:hypothetical protein